MKKRAAAFLLALCLLMTPALAASDSMDNFIRTKTYVNQFSDLAKDSVFYGNVSALYEYGLSVGKLDGTFGLKDSLTVGQAIIFAGRIRSLYRTGDPEAGPAAYSSPNMLTATPYLLYLQAEGALDHALDESLTSVATRAQMAHILANVLPEAALPSIHDSLVTEAYATRKAITDVNEYTPYFLDILALYRKGICIGSDVAGSFLPEAPITRGAAAAMLTRMVDPALRVTPQWSLSSIPEPAATTFAQLVTPGTYYRSPATQEEIDESIRYMLAGNSSTLQLQYSSISSVQIEPFMGNLLDIIKTYCEQCYNSVSCTYSTAGDVALTFSAAGAGTQLPSYRDATMNAALAVREQLWSEGLITTDMTEMEIARVYYTWICENCTYDHSSSEESLSHIAYSLFAYGSAVCDGYTGAYNLLLKLEGIDCTAILGDNHIWTAAVLDGTEYHIDVTWGDSNESQVNYLYFAMTPEQSQIYHAE